MTKQIFRSIFAGIIMGLAFFVLPFVLIRLFIFFALMGLAFKVIRGKRHRYAYAHCGPMSNEQREAWMNARRESCGYYSPSEKKESENNQQ